MSWEEAASEKYRLAAREPSDSETMAGAEDLPDALKGLSAKGVAIYERVRRLDADRYGVVLRPANEVGEQHRMLEAMFARD
jgi:hypothetical protein